MIEIFLDFFAERGGGLLIPKYPYQKKLGPPNCWKGAGGSQDFGVFLKKKKQFFLDASPKGADDIHNFNVNNTIFVIKMIICRQATDHDDSGWGNADVNLHIILWLPH